MAIFGRVTARQRLRRATRESLAIPVFSSAVDCTPWVTGGLWPAEFSTITAETATLAEYLKADLQRISNSANDELKIIKRVGIADSARQAAEARVIDEARARAVRRVESTIRHLQTVKAEAPADVQPTVDAPTDAAPEPQESTQSERNTPVAGPLAGEDDEPEAFQARRRASADDNADEAAVIPESEAALGLEAAEPVGDAESASERLQRLLAFVVRQEPRLNWAVGDYADGTTVLVTDLAHGWIPPGIALPAGVRLLEPERRSGKVSALVDNTTRTVTYTLGDPVGRSADFAVTEPSVQPRELPAVDDLGWELGRVTHWRDGLPRMVHTLAKAAAAGTGVVDEEADLLRVHLDTARYQLLIQYPDVDPALLLNCLLLAATEASVVGDAVSANYHLAWFQKLSEPPGSQWATKP